MKRIYKFLLACALGAHSYAIANVPQWSLDDSTDGWNKNSIVKTYFHYSELQRQWAWELLGKQHLQGSEAILDFGCGDGKVSAELSRFVPQGKVVGVDISSEMLALANMKFPSYAYPNLEFRKSMSMLFNDIPAQHSYDMICSFCVFHLVACPVEVLKNLKDHLKPTGKLVLVIPAGKNPALITAADDIFAKYQLDAPWKSHPVSSATLSMRTTQGWSRLLDEAGYKILSLEMIDTDTPFYDKEELVTWMIGTMTANWNIPLKLSRAFSSDLVDRMCELDSEVIDQEGRVHFKLSRIHVVAMPV